MKFKTAKSTALDYTALTMIFLPFVRLYFIMSLYFTPIYLPFWTSFPVPIDCQNAGSCNLAVIVRSFVALPFTGADAKRTLALEKFAYRSNEQAEHKLTETIKSTVSAAARQELLKSF